jgi:hypothetical protein
VGSAASDAFAAAAEARAISTDELGDLVVPRLGFERGPRVLACGDKTIELQLGLDGKLGYRDPARGVAIKSLPKTASKELKAELKQLGNDLRQAIKTQRLRHERMLITQRRWAGDAWRALYGDHPLLRPFAVQLVWAQYGAAGAVARTFRMLEDGSFTDAADDAVQLDPALRIGIAHPLDLDPEQRSAWQAHLADHEVQPPFAQLERAVHRASAAQAAERVLRTVENVKVAFGSLRGRAQKRGWARGSIVDGGGIASYVRRFPAVEVDVLLELEGGYIGLDPTEQVTLGAVWFVKSGSVQTGSYVYDEPRDATDPRVLPLGDVPAIVYSETLADLLLMQGGEREDGEAAGEGDDA